jgi:Fe-S protein assembly co-chaperone HscB
LSLTTPMKKANVGAVNRSMSNHFQVLQLPQALPVDMQLLQERYHAQQLKSHPDRHVQASPEARHQAIQQTMAITEAYRVLREPMLAAAHFLELHDTGIQETPSARLLMETMEAQETLAELDTEQAMQNFIAEQQQKMEQSWQNFYQQCALSHWAEARDFFTALRFLHALLRDAQAKLK